MGFVDTEDPNTGDIRRGQWRDEIPNSRGPGSAGIQQQGSNNYSLQAEQIRRQFMHYFNGVGAVDWQSERALYH